MSPTGSKKEQANSAVNGGSSGNELGELRKILVQSEQVGEVLPDALRESARRDDRLAEATLPIVEENIRQSVQRNPRILAEAIFPIIGPAIRKAISEALAQMIQSLNQTLERSLSPQGLKWRLEAMQTGKPFAEVVILHSLIYRVEQVFLIHKETGILLQHVALNAAETQDGEMVSAMLTAIQDFVRDSFKTSDDATLDSLRVKDFSIWIENSPDAILAAVIRGNAPLTLREIFLEAIERIQFEQENDFQKFKGDTTVFEDTKPVLQECLQMRLDEKSEPKGGIFTPFNVLAAVLGVLLVVAGFFYIRDYRRWSNYLDRLRHEPGIVVTEAERGFFRHELSGLRDPLAVAPESLAGEYGYAPDDVAQNWKPFQDAAPEFVLKRAEKLLAPPPGVRLAFENGALTADGPAPAAWFAEAQRLAPALAGVTEFRIGAGGLKQSIEAQTIGFGCGTTELTADGEKALAAATAAFELLSAAGGVWRVEIEGRADASGTDAANAEISRARADKILAEIFAKSEKLKQNRQNFSAVGTGAGGAAECAAGFHVYLE
ncbi:MAG: OmpA family protein [Acidobacteria bacterium]|nr:OmpA family protein [Acidobacteriota bacterium]